MRLDFFLLADSAKVGEGGKITIRGAEVTRVSGRIVPFQVRRLASVAGFLLDSTDIGTEPTVALAGWKPDGTVLFRIEPQVAPPGILGPHNLPEGEEVRLSFIVALDGLEFPEEGAYRLDVELNGEVVGRRMLAVVAEPSSAEHEGEAEASDD